MALQNIEANITLDLYNHDTTPSTVKAIQLDSQTRYIAAMLQSMGAQYDVDSGATVQLIVIRPDKVGVQIVGTTFTYGDEGAQFLGPYAELTQVALAVNGKMRGQFKITSGDQILRTEIFAISNGEALDASTDEWADEYDGYNLEEMSTSIETNTADIATLEADVSQIKEDLSAIQKESTESEDTFDISDADGNVVARFANGEIKTKNFDSSEFSAVKESVEELDATATKAELTNGDEFNITDPSGNSIVKFKDGHIQTKFFNSLNVVEPIVVTVKQDGTGDFRTIRAAVDSITDANSETKPYEIHVYAGTYNVFDDYTQAEIETAGEGAYIQDGSGFVGILLNDGVSMKGIGNRDDVILHGELDTTTYSQALRNNVSTLNLRDEMSLENITVTAKNIRYCVHDDFTPTKKPYKRVVKNCKFRGKALTSGTECKTWGEGSRQGKTTILDDCDFGTCMAWHSDNQASATMPSTLIVKNCTAFYAMINGYKHSVKNSVYLYGNNFTFARYVFSSGSTNNYTMNVDGTDQDVMISAPNDWNYTSGDIVRFSTNGNQTLNVGQLVNPNTSPYWPTQPLIVSTDPLSAYGVVVGTDDEFIYVQRGGFYDASRFGFSGLAVGDKITVKVDGTLEVNGTGETFGVVCSVTKYIGAFFRRCA